MTWRFVGLCSDVWLRRCASVESGDGFESLWLEDGDGAAEELDVSLTRTCPQNLNPGCFCSFCLKYSMWSSDAYEYKRCQKKQATSNVATVNTIYCAASTIN
eukprot:m.1061489 g.1061489  ORF g.1061489 m.1061489 type:complete len:102 (+) comp24212_c0_seq12:322-627(+)